jgi:hypothetical protein
MSVTNLPLILETDVTVTLETVAVAVKNSVSGETAEHGSFAAQRKRTSNIERQHRTP